MYRQAHKWMNLKLDLVEVLGLDYTGIPCSDRQVEYSQMISDYYQKNTDIMPSLEEQELYRAT